VTGGRASYWRSSTSARQAATPSAYAAAMPAANRALGAGGCRNAHAARHASAGKQTTRATCVWSGGGGHCCLVQCATFRTLLPAVAQKRVQMQGALRACVDDRRGRKSSRSRSDWSSASARLPSSGTVAESGAPSAAAAAAAPCAVHPTLSSRTSRRRAASGWLGWESGLALREVRRSHRANGVAAPLLEPQRRRYSVASAPQCPYLCWYGRHWSYDQPCSRTMPGCDAEVRTRCASIGTGVQDAGTAHPSRPTFRLGRQCCRHDWLRHPGMLQAMNLQCSTRFASLQYACARPAGAAQRIVAPGSRSAGCKVVCAVYEVASSNRCHGLLQQPHTASPGYK